MGLPLKVFLLQAGFVDLDFFAHAQPHEVIKMGGRAQGFWASWDSFQSMVHLFRVQPPDLMIVTEREKAFWEPRVSWTRGGCEVFHRLLRRPVDIFILAIFMRAVRRNIPVAMMNRSDSGRFTPGSEWFFRRCHASFVRELHPLPEIALQDLFTPSGGHPQTNRRSRQLISWLDPDCPQGRNAAKLRPISLGIPDEAVSGISWGAPKQWDLFFAGDFHEKGMRGRLIEEVRAMAHCKKWKVLLRDRMPYQEYLQCLAASRLCLSPPGMGWDCWRHYEAMLAGSIPLMTYPTILQHRPAIEGEHCFYFAPEPGGLTRCLEKALAYPERLPAMAAAGRQLVLEHHLFSKLREYVIQETLAASCRPK